MRIAIWLVTASLALFSAPQSSAPQATGQSPSSSAHFKLSLAAAGPLKLRSPLLVNVTLTNITPNSIPLFSGPAFHFFRVSVTQSGSELHRTALHRWLRGQPDPDDPPLFDTGTSVAFDFPAGKSYTVSMDLAKLYDFPKPGTYTVTVSRYDEVQKMEVTSAPVQITVAP